MDFSVTHIEETIYILEKQLGLPAYDYEFSSYFECKHPISWEDQIVAIGRIGATNDYPTRYEQLLDNNIRLIHTPEEYCKTSFLPTWYPIIEEYTPRSKWYDMFPSVAEVENSFEFPVFIKGERQTNRHSRTKSIITNPRSLNELQKIWEDDPILYWQKVVVREYIPLELVVSDDGFSMPKALEFRTFWWKSRCWNN